MAYPFVQSIATSTISLSSGIPIYGTAGVGYALDADYEMPALTLTRLELNALMLGVEMLTASADNDLGQRPDALE